MINNDTKSILLLQLSNWWNDLDSDAISSVIPEAMKQMEQDFQAMPSPRFFKDGKMVFSPYHSVTWSIFLFRVAKLLSNKGAVKEADAVYYLNKIMNSVDWYHGIDLPIHFMAEHPLGSVLGRAKYGDYFFVYQGTTVGGNRIPGGGISYPTIGDHVLMYANSTILGNSVVGNNVIISADCYVLNEVIPDNCIVFGQSPNLVIKEKLEKDIRNRTSHIWR